jgi:thioredoxin-related protein/HEAT repeat protein/thiol-disulfide isomerase/thioredoxin
MAMTFLFVLSAQAWAQDKALVWQSNYEEARLLAIEHNRSLFVFFGYDACVYCRKMKDEVFAKPEVKTALKDFVLVRVNVKKQPHLASLYHIEGVPAIYIHNPDGEVLTRLSGYLPADRFLAWLKQGVDVADEGAILLALKALDSASELSAEEEADLLAALATPAVSMRAREQVLKAKSFPAKVMVKNLLHKRLAVRLACLELLEDIVGTNHGYNPWQPESSASRKAFGKWQSWAQSAAISGGQGKIYVSLSRAEIKRQLLVYLTTGDKRSAHAFNTLRKAGHTAATSKGVIECIRDYVADAPDLTFKQERMLQKLRWAVMMPVKLQAKAEMLAHRLVYGGQDVRLAAMEELRKEGGEDTLTFFAELLADADPIIREYAAEALVDYPPVKAIELLAARLRRDKVSRQTPENDVNVKISIISSLKALKAGQEDQLIAQQIGSNEDLSVAALEALAVCGRVKSKDISQIIRQALKDKSWRVRAAALKVVGEKKVKALRQAVRERFDDSEEYVAQLAVKVAAKCSDRGSKEMLLKLFSTKDRMKGAVVVALVKMGMKSSLPKDLPQRLKGKSPDIWVEVVEALAGTHDVKLLRPFISAADPAVVVASIDAITSDLPYDSSERERLRKLLVKVLDRPELEIKLAACRGLRARRFVEDDREKKLPSAAYEEDTAVLPESSKTQVVIKVRDKDKIAADAEDELLAAFIDDEDSKPAIAIGKVENGTSQHQPVIPVKINSDDSDEWPEEGVEVVVAKSTKGQSSYLSTIKNMFKDDAANEESDKAESEDDELVGMFGADEIEDNRFEVAKSKSIRTVVGARELICRKFVEWMSGEDEELAFEAALSLASYGDQRACGYFKSQIDLYSINNKVEVVKALARTPGKRSLKTLLSLLKSDNKELLEAVLGALSQRAGSGAAEAILKFGGDEQGKDVFLALSGFVGSISKKTPAAKKYLKAVLSAELSDSAGARQHLLIMLAGWLGDKGSISALLRLGRHQNEFIRRSALLSLIMIDQRQGRKLALRLADDESPWVRRVVAKAFDTARGNSPVASYMIDKDQIVRFYRRVYSYQEEDIILLSSREKSLVSKMAQDKDLQVRVAARMILMKSGKRVDFEAFARDLNKDKSLSNYTLLNAMQNLSNRKREGSLPVLRILLRDNNSYVNEQAMSLLRSYRSAEAIALRKQLKGGRVKDITVKSDKAGTVAYPEFSFASGADDESEVVIEELSLAKRSQKNFLAYFYTPGCQECVKVDAILDELQTSFPQLEVRRMNITNTDMLLWNEAMSEMVGLDEKQRLISPALFNSAGALITDDITMEKAVALVVTGEGLPAPWVKINTRLDAAREVIVDRYESFRIGTLIVAGLLDGVNPCAFTTIIFLLSYLVYQGHGRKQMLVVGLAFAGAVFIAYYLVGLGLLRVILELSFMPLLSKIVYWVTAGFTLVIGFVTLFDGVLALKGRLSDSVLKLPQFLKRRIQKRIHQGASLQAGIAAAFVTGFCVSLLELACTGQVYAPTLVMISRVPGTVWSARFYLLLYNAMFIVPLLVVFAMAFFGLTSGRLSAFFRRHVALVRFMTAGLFFFFFVFMLLRL